MTEWDPYRTLEVLNDYRRDLAKLVQGIYQDELAIESLRDGVPLTNRIGFYNGMAFGVLGNLDYSLASSEELVRQQIGIMNGVQYLFREGGE